MPMHPSRGGRRMVRDAAAPENPFRGGVGRSLSPRGGRRRPPRPLLRLSRRSLRGAEPPHAAGGLRGRDVAALAQRWLGGEVNRQDASRRQETPSKKALFSSWRPSPLGG